MCKEVSVLRLHFVAIFNFVLLTIRMCVCVYVCVSFVFTKLVLQLISSIYEIYAQVICLNIFMSFDMHIDDRIFIRRMYVFPRITTQVVV